MGIGGPQLALCARMQEDGLFDGMNSVIELGSQVVGSHGYHHAIVKRFLASRGLADVAPETLTARQFFEILGFGEYACIDANGELGAHPLDLNYDVRARFGFDGTADLITNFGTCEHVFNIYECFKNIHNICNVGGLMIHVMPLEGYLDHGFYNFKPHFFYALCLANSYKIENIYYMVSPVGAANRRYGRTLMPIEFKENLFDVLADKSLRGEFPSTPMGNYSELFVVLRKTGDEDFKMPYDMLFHDRSTMKSEYPTAYDGVEAYFKKTIEYTDGNLSRHFENNRQNPIKVAARKALSTVLSDAALNRLKQMILGSKESSTN